MCVLAVQGLNGVTDGKTLISKHSTVVLTKITTIYRSWRKHKYRLVFTLMGKRSLYFRPKWYRRYELLLENLLAYMILRAIHIYIHILTYIIECTWYLRRDLTVIITTTTTVRQQWNGRASRSRRRVLQNGIIKRERARIYRHSTASPKCTHNIFVWCTTVLPVLLYCCTWR